MKKYCFIDLDGVLADFHSSAFKLFGHKEPETWPEGEAAWLPNQMGISEGDFWSKIDEDFWINLEVMPDAHNILMIITDYIPIENCCILTSPSLNCEGASGKMWWIMHHFPVFQRRFLIGAAKEMCAGHNKILVDDLEKNVDKFANAGGHGLLLPRPWNINRGLNTLDTLDRELKLFIER